MIYQVALGGPHRPKKCYLVLRNGLRSHFWVVYAPYWPFTAILCLFVFFFLTLAYFEWCGTLQIIGIELVDRHFLRCRDLSLGYCFVAVILLGLLKGLFGSFWRPSQALWDLAGPSVFENSWWLPGRQSAQDAAQTAPKPFKASKRPTKGLQRTSHTSPRILLNHPEAFQDATQRATQKRRTRTTFEPFNCYVLIMSFTILYFVFLSLSFSSSFSNFRVRNLLPLK